MLQPLRAFGRPLADMLAPIPYLQVQRMFDDGFPHGQQNYWKSNFLRALNADAIETIVNHVRRCPSPGSAIAIEQLGGAVNRIGRDATAFSHRDARFNLLIVGTWPDRLACGENIAWVRGLWEAMAPHSADEVYVNYLGQESDEGPDRVEAAYGPEKYARLVELKRRYDPENLFRLNQNIRPRPALWPPATTGSEPEGRTGAPV